MSERTRAFLGKELPSFIYGTAWKEERTAELVTEALEAGFRGVDTANQRRHYHEAGVGQALARAFEGDGPDREELFLQTKYTFPSGQDHRMPYDPGDPVASQVGASLRSSLDHLGVEVVDGLLLHGPSQRRGLGEADREAWRAMEELVYAGLVRTIGVSNVAPDQLRELCGLARVLPAFVQNRCFARTRWDAPVREVCRDEGIVYQAFSLLTANRGVLGDPSIREIAEGHGRSVPQVIFRFAQQVGMIPLTGTTDPEHMAEDLEIHGFELSPDERGVIQDVAL